MSRRFWSVAVLAVASLGLCGCPVLLVGAGVAGGYAISKDSIKNHLEMPKDVLYQESYDVLKQMGLITLEDKAHGLLKAKVVDSTVTVTIKPVTRKTNELVVEARNQFLLPDLDTAQAVYNKIIERL